jgi:NTE family protein
MKTGSNFSLHTTPFSLVLSGGGALGIAHLGVLHDMERLELHPAEIIGTSMGGIVGASLAIGKSEAEIWESIQAFVQVSKWLNLSFDGNAIVKSRKIREIFETIFDDRRMRETDTPLTLIATDLLTGEKVLFDPRSDTPIVDALLATMAIPGIFEEQHIDGRVLGDGFLCANLGLDEATLDTVLAVDVLGNRSFTPTLPDNFFKTANVIEMMDRSLRLLILNQTRSADNRLKEHGKHLLLIEPDTAGFKTFHFNKAEAIRERGLGLLMEMLP